MKYPAKRSPLITAVLLGACAVPFAAAQKSETAIDHYIEDSLSAIRTNGASPGSLFNGQSYLAELARDPKAATVGDLISIRVAEQASALSSGTTSSSRSSAADHSITSLFKPLGAAGALANLASTTNDSTLEGQGSTSRQTQVTATLTAHVTHVMPNGNLIIEGLKEVLVNSERQIVWLRGVVRPADVSPDNSVRSDRIAMMDLRINGKGVVEDAIRRPNILYRIFSKILPF
jgi:flagellar L-ring protein precursor FlgH